MDGLSEHEIGIGPSTLGQARDTGQPGDFECSAPNITGARVGGHILAPPGEIGW
jgi:hypothetical protein